MKTLLNQLCMFCCVAALLPATADGFQAERVPIQFEKPGQREFVVDKANLLTSADEQQIKTICDSLLTDTSRPLLVVTIDSMAAHGGKGLSIENFARYLFGQLGLGRDDDNDGNRGMLLLVSSGDRKVRIELGADWPVSADRKAAEITQRAIVPRFKRRDFSGGIKAGVEALTRLARSADSQPAERPAGSSGTSPSSPPVYYPEVDSHYVRTSHNSSDVGGGFCCLLLLVVLFLPMLGRGGGFFSIISMILFGMASNMGGSGSYRRRRYRRSRRDRDDDDDSWFGGSSGGGGFGGFGGGFSGGSSGGGFSGGSFGGGFSGGGGATGSW